MSKKTQGKGKCKVCGEIFEKKVWNHYCCSLTCKKLNNKNWNSIKRIKKKLSKKNCIICGKEFKLKVWNQYTCSKNCSEIYTNKRQNIYYYENKKEELERRKTYHYENKEKIEKRRRTYFQNNKKKIHKRDKKRYNTIKYWQHIERNYGMSKKNYDNLLNEQKNSCSICGLKTKDFKSDYKKRFCIDHCHKTGRIRGLLCDSCNSAIGNFKDNLDILASAMSYLQQDVYTKKTKQEKKYKEKKQSRNSYLKRKYGITLEDYNYLLNEQNNCCSICGKDFTLLKSFKIHVDHNHHLNAVRGVLCSQCNLGIGHFKDNLDILASAICYLQQE